MTETKHLTPKELADRLNVSIHTVNSWREKGVGPAYIKLEGTIRYRLEAVEKYEYEANVKVDE